MCFCWSNSYKIKEHHTKTNVNPDLPLLDHQTKSPGFAIPLTNSPKSRERERNGPAGLAEAWMIGTLPGGEAAHGTIVEMNGFIHFEYHPMFLVGIDVVHEDASKLCSKDKNMKRLHVDLLMM